MDAKNILSNEELMDFLDDAPYSEGEPLLMFLPELKAAADAISQTGVKLQDRRARTLFFVRAVYFLGVLRGGEAYRSFLLAEAEDEDIPDDVPFKLSESCTYCFAEEIKTMKASDLETFYRLMGFEKGRNMLEKVKVTITREDGKPLCDEAQEVQSCFLTDAAPFLIVQKDGATVESISGGILELLEFTARQLECMGVQRRRELCEAFGLEFHAAQKY